MARRRKKDDGGGIVIILLFLLATFVVGLVFLTPVFVLGYLIYAHYKDRPFKEIKTTQELKSSFKEDVEQYETLKSEIQKLDENLDVVKNSGGELSLRNDGYFDERSKKGKELNVLIRELELSIDNLRDLRSSVGYRIESGITRWIKSKARVKSSQYAFQAFLAGFFFFKFSDVNPDFIRKTGEFVSQYSFIKLGEDWSIYFGAMLTICLLTAATGYFGFRLARKSLLNEYFGR